MSVGPLIVVLRGQHGVDIGSELRQEAQLAHRDPRRLPRALDVEQRRHALLEFPRLGAHVAQHGFERARIAVGHRGFGDLPALQLPLEESERQRRVRLVERVDAVQRQQVLRARHRILQRAIGLVHPCRRLQRDPLLGRARRRMAIRMHLALQRVVGAVEQGGIEAETFGQAEQLEMIAREIDHESKQGPGSNFRDVGKIEPGPCFIVRR